MDALQRLLRSDVDGQLADDAAVAIAQTTLRVRRRDRLFVSLPEGFFKNRANHLAVQCIQYFLYANSSPGLRPGVSL